MNIANYLSLTTFLFLCLGLFHSCQTETAPTWTPQFLDKAQAPLVDAMATVIIAQEGKPREVVPLINNFIDTTVLRYSGYEQLQFRKGIKVLEGQAQYFTGRPFLDCKEAEQLQCIQLLEEEAKDSWKRTGEKPFFLTFKELVLAGAAKG